MPAPPDTLTGEHYHRLGNQLRIEGRPVEAEAAFKQAIAADPSYIPAYISLAYLHHYREQRDKAADLLAALTQRNPADAILQKQVGTLLSDFGYTQEALAVYQTLVRQHPKDAGAHLLLGRSWQASGHNPEAIRAFQRALELDEGLGAAWLLLAQARHTQAENTSLAERYELALRSPNLGKDTRICLHFGLGKIYDDLGLHDPAFAHFQQGNAFWHADHPFDREAMAAAVAAMRRSFGGKRLPAVARNGAPAPVFVIGMLRSGTTLVERVIASHPRAFGLGETELADMLADKTADFSGQPYPESVFALTAGQKTALAAQYRLQWPPSAASADCVVDKNPLNFLHVGLLATLFPEARFVHCIRDPLDTCLSIYFQHFAHQRNSYAYDLGDIGFFYDRYRELMDLWRSILPAGRIYELQYSELASQPETAIPELIGWLGLPWDPACLSPHLYAGDIRTASAWQARRPIHGGSVGRARHYWKHLAGLRAQLGYPEKD